MPMILIRHGESSAVSDPHLWSIQSNYAVGLSTKGVEQCVALSSVMNKVLSLLPDSIVDDLRVYHSTMVRSIQTHRICADLLKFRTIRGSNPLGDFNVGFGISPIFNEFLDWSKHPESKANEKHKIHHNDLYDMWLEDHNLLQPNVRSWKTMKDEMTSCHHSVDFMSSSTNAKKLRIAFIHHYPINAILSRVTPYSENEVTIRKSYIQHIEIPNAVPILIGFPENFNVPGTLQGKSLVEASQKHQVSA